MEQKDTCMICEHMERIHWEFCCDLKPVRKVINASGSHHEGVKIQDIFPRGGKCDKFKLPKDIEEFRKRQGGIR